MNEKKMEYEELVCSENCWMLNSVIVIVEYSLNKIESRGKTFCSSKKTPLKYILRMTYIVMNFQILINILQKKERDREGTLA